MLLNLINNQPDIDKIYLYDKDPYEGKYQFLINERESTGLKHSNDLKAFIEYSDHMQDVYRNIDADKERKILIVFDDMVDDIINNKRLKPIVTELFIRDRKLNIPLVFIVLSYFKFPKDVRLTDDVTETMKLLGCTENKITKDKKGENVLHLQITEVVLVHCNIINKIQESCTGFFEINRSVVYKKFLQQIIFFKKHLTRNSKTLKYSLQIKIVNH